VYVVETDLKTAQADAQTIHDRYKDLALVEREFRTLKTGTWSFVPGSFAPKITPKPMP